MSAVWTIAAKDLRLRWRDHSALLAGVVAPLTLAVLISLAFGRSETRFTATYAVVDGDHGALAAAFTDLFAQEGLRDVVTVRRLDDAAAARRQVDDGKVAAAFVIPAGFSTATTGAATTSIEVVRNAKAPIGGDVAESIARGFADHVQAGRLAVATAVASGAPASEMATLAQQVATMEAPFAVEEVSAVRAKLPAGSYFAPAMGVFFCYFVAALGARSLIAERKNGTIARLLAAPIGGRALLAGKALSTLLLAVTSLTTMAIVSRLALNARWGDVPTVALLIVDIAFAVTAITACVLTFARTEQQAALFMSLVTYAMALLGGNFVSLAQAPGWLRRLALLTPNGWALRAFGDLAADGGGLHTALPAVLAIGAFGVVTAAVALLRSNVLVRP
jgi:ABC-2 type transport system permease protein